MLTLEKLKESKVALEGYVLVGWRRITENKPDPDDYYYLGNGNGKETLQFITVPKNDIVIEPIFRSLPGYNKGTVKEQENETALSDPVKIPDKNDTQPEAKEEAKTEKNDRNNSASGTSQSNSREYDREPSALNSILRNIGK